MASRERKIDGKTYTRYASYSTKAQAESVAKRMRAKPNPQKVRIIKTDKGYTLYQL